MRFSPESRLPYYGYYLLKKILKKRKT